MYRNVFEESEVSRLQQELNEKDRALTEARLEVLSAQHQLQAQTDTIVKLQVTSFYELEVSVVLCDYCTL